MRPFGEAQSKAMKAYAQSGQYHTIVESRVRTTTVALFLMRFDHLFCLVFLWEIQVKEPKLYKAS